MTSDNLHLTAPLPKVQRRLIALWRAGQVETLQRHCNRNPQHRMLPTCNMEINSMEEQAEERRTLGME